MFKNSVATSCRRGVNLIAANNSDFGGILKLYRQYSAIPIGMAAFRRNPKFTVSVVVTPLTKSTLVQGVASDSQTAACNGARDWLADH